MKNTIIWVWVLVAAAGNAQSAENGTLGLALAGGGALGFTHIGVVQVLEELGISADVVAGTSIGGIVGALYAVGYSAREMVAIARTVDWNRILYDQPARANLDYEEKQESRQFRARLSFQDGDLLLRSGASNGQAAVEVLDDLLRHYAVEEDFTRLPRPVAIVAADLMSGEEVVFQSGDLKSAVRASLAVPGLFSPLFYDGRFLIDGGWVNNMPVDAAIDLGADSVIAVNLNILDRTEEDLTSLQAVLDQSSRILRRERIVRNLEMADVVITPDLSGYSQADFDRVEELIGLGRLAAWEKRDQLLALKEQFQHSTGDAGSAVERPLVHPESDRRVKIRNVTVRTPPGFGQPDLDGFELDQLVGRTVSLRDLQTQVYGVYDGVEFEYVSYDLLPADGHHTYDLDVYVVPRPRSDASINVGGGVRAQLVESRYTRPVFHGNYERLLGTSNVGLSVDAWFTNVGSLRVGLNVPVSRKVRVEPTVYAFTEPLLFYDERVVASEYVSYRIGGEVKVGVPMARRWHFSGAPFTEWTDASRQRGASRIEPGGAFRAGIGVSVERDTLNRPLFPRSGDEAALHYRVYVEPVEKSLVNRAEFYYRRYFTVSSDVTLRGRLSAGSFFTPTVPLLEQFALGGVERFDGYYFQEVRGTHYGVFGTDVRVGLFDMPVGTGERAYLHVGGNLGSVWNGASASAFRNGVIGGGKIGLGLNTVIGELHLGAAVSDSGEVSSFLFLGPSFTVNGDGYSW